MSIYLCFDIHLIDCQTSETIYKVIYFYVMRIRAMIVIGFKDQPPMQPFGH